MQSAFNTRGHLSERSITLLELFCPQNHTFTPDTVLEELVFRFHWDGRTLDSLLARLVFNKTLQEKCNLYINWCLHNEKGLWHSLLPKGGKTSASKIILIQLSVSGDTEVWTICNFQKNCQKSLGWYFLLTNKIWDLDAGETERDTYYFTYTTNIVNDLDSRKTRLYLKWSVI